MGIDYGSKRIGLAISDESGRLAFPAGVLRRVGKRKDLEALKAFARERGVEQVVIGLPLHMNGTEGPEARAVLSFADELHSATGLPVEAVDERWTSREAERALSDARGGKRKRGRSGDIDAAAAALVLRTWLERQDSAQRDSR